MKKLILHYLLYLALIGFSHNAYSQAQHDIKQVAYRWKNVQYVGGGFVDGIVFHPTAKDVCYCRTDMGGAYRRNPETMIWEPLMDWISYKDMNLMGVESIALDPSNPDKLYLSCGTYTNPLTPDGAVLRSDDRGKTFERTNVPFKMGGNEDGRGNGERMAVDPLNGNIIFLGTKQNGLWKSTDGAKTWNQVTGFPDVSEKTPAGMMDRDSVSRWMRMNRGSGVIFVLFNPKSQRREKFTASIFAGVSLMNRESIFETTDAGITWRPVKGQPVNLRPVHAVMARNGMLYVTYGDAPGPSRMKNGAVWKYNSQNGEWTDITPDRPNPATRPFGYAGIAVQPDKPDVLIVSSFNRYQVDNGEDIFRSIDGGKSWKQVFASGAIIDSKLAPYTAHTGIHWLFDLEMDPFNPDHALFTTGYGGHETFNLTAMDRNQVTVWQIMSPGIEETVPLDLLSPPDGAAIITAIGDYGGAVYWDPDHVPDDNFSNPRFGNTNGLACAERKPSVIVRVGRATEDNPGKTIGFSIDGGKNWNPSVSIPHPDAALGHIAVSAYGTSWVWSPDPVSTGFGFTRKFQPLPVYVTKDNGLTWHKSTGIPPYTRVIADRLNDSTFYGMDLFKGKLYISNDWGNSFLEHDITLPGGIPRPGRRGDSRGGQDRLYTTPGKHGELWIAAFDGLYFSGNEGKDFMKINAVEEIHGFGFGKGITDSIPALYMIGNIKGVRGIFRSDDFGTDWVQITDDMHQWGLLMHITGDPKKYGRVYVGTHGRGTLYGDPL